MIRLDRLLSSRGYCTRKEAVKLLRAGRVTVRGIAPRRVDERVEPDDVLVDGSPLDPGPGLVLMLNKPAGYVCSREDPGALVFELLPERYLARRPPVSCVGRLDKDTTGLLLLTDDGQLVHRLTSPKKDVAKLYEVELADPLRGDEQELFRSGTMTLADDPKPLKPAFLEVEGERRAKLTLFEGRYHQVRRMFAAIGNRVVALHRSKVGSLELGGLEPGRFRVLMGPEIALAGEEHGRE